jgi:ATP-dependent RNA helicase DDX23/PRP28
MLMKSTISKVPEELRKHDAAQQKPNRGPGKRNDEHGGSGKGRGGGFF